MLVNHEEEIRKAEVLIEALSYIRKFRGKYVVVKLGGSVMENPDSIRDLLIDVVFMQSVGMRPVVVHGGGKAITKAMSDAGIEARTYYPVSLHLQECYKGLGYKKGDLKESESASPETLAIPIYPELDTEKLSIIVKNINEGLA